MHVRAKNGGGRKHKNNTIITMAAYFENAAL